MGQRIKQVAITYLTRRWLAIGAAVMAAALLVVGLVVKLTHSPTDAPPAAMLIGIPTMCLSLLVAHAKVQFAHPRAAVMPNFVAPHLIVLALILVLVLFGYPLLVALAIGWNPLGLPALATAIAIPIIWSMQLNRGLLLLVTLGVFFTAMSPLGLRWWLLPNESLAPVHVLIVLSGWVAAAAWLWRLSQLREEMDDYAVPVVWPSDGPSRAESAAVRSLVARHFGRHRLAAAVVDWWHARRREGDRSTLRGRMRLLEYGLNAWPIELTSFVWACLFLAIGSLGGELISHPMRRLLHFNLGWMLLVLTCMLPGAKLAYHRPQMVGELMFPITRTQLVDALFAAIARQVGVLWILLVVAALFVVARYPHESVTLPAVATFLLFSATLVAVSFGLGAYFATWRSVVLRSFAFVLCWIPFLALFDLWTWLAETVGLMPIIVLAVLHVTVAVAITRVARAKWLSLELG